MAKYWYSYNNIGDPFLPASYKRTNVPFNPECTSGSKICAVLAEGSPHQVVPIKPFSANIQNYIVVALTSSVPEPRNAAKAFVYKKF